MNKIIQIGIPSLDKKLKWLRRGQVTVIASRPSMGKTTLVLNIAAHASIKDKVPCVIFSTIDSKESVVRRLLSAHSGVKYSDIQDGCIAKSVWTKLQRAAKDLSNAPIYVDDTPCPDVHDIQAVAWRLKKENNLELIIVDHVQLIKGYKNELSKIMCTLKAIASELSIPVIVLSQLHRRLENRKNKRPLLTDLPYSPNIRKYADTIILIYRDGLYHHDSVDAGRAEIIIAKNSHGWIGTVEVAFNHTTFCFEDV